MPSLRDLSYEERLKKLQLPTLTERRERGDMFMLYKCVEGMEKMDVKEYVIPSQSSLRGHSKKLYKKRLKKDVKKYSFPDRAIDKCSLLHKHALYTQHTYYITHFAAQTRTLVHKHGLYTPHSLYHTLYSTNTHSTT